LWFLRTPDIAVGRLVVLRGPEKLLLRLVAQEASV